MTATAEKTQLSQDWPLTVFHRDGVRTTPATDQQHYDRLMGQGWVDIRVDPMPPPPPPAEPDMTPEEKAAVMSSELEGLGDQVDAQAQTVATIEERLTTLEAVSHEPFDFDPLLARVDTLEQSRRGSSGVTGAFQDRLNAAEAGVTEVKASMSEAAQTLTKILERIEALETKKQK